MIFLINRKTTQTLFFFLGTINNKNDEIRYHDTEIRKIIDCNRRRIIIFDESVKIINNLMTSGDFDGILQKGKKISFIN